MPVFTSAFREYLKITFQLFFRELPEALINPKTETQYQQWTELPNFDKVTLFNQMKKLLKNSIDEALKPTLKGKVSLALTYGLEVRFFDDLSICWKISSET